ncbi:hypothetical protein N7492_006419 [Penicillium capsulatum]|uniref:Uncharacterized protein n=1 Tax=Penicillium capsulatum TaxID=69766 RepID=A0A9W9LJR1_9EURO|nr:hypothetical protein N7492_006419 [Penicillium capsulatum]KAJ6116259.1 hypothetical protein N7512_005984 [Penicillium capsulatum]
MSAWSVLLSCDVVLSPDQSHVYRRYATSPNFGQSFATHLAAFASLSQQEREKIIDKAPAVLSCEVKGQSSIKQLDPMAPLSSFNMDLEGEPKSLTELDQYACLPDANFLCSSSDSFPYNMDFSPWLHFDDDSDEPMDIEESVPTVDSTGASAPGTQTTSHIVDPTLVSAPNTTNNSLVISGMPEMSTAPQSAGGIKTLIEDSLEQMHTRLVEDGALDSILGKAFTCIFDYQPDLGRVVQTNFNTTDGDDSVTRFFEIICGKFKLLSSVFTSHSVKGRVGLNLLRESWPNGDG